MRELQKTNNFIKQTIFKINSGAYTIQYARALYFSLVSRTPVLNGFARGNWAVTVDSIPPSKTLKKNLQPFPVISRSFGTLFITNLLPYIVPLENGHSKEQAPNGFLKQAEQDARINANKF